MRVVALALCLFAAGAVASYAVATPPPGKGHMPLITTAATTTVPGKGHAGKVVLCHRTGSKSHPFVKLVVNAKAVKAHLKHGDVLPLSDGSCPKPAAPTTTTAPAPATTTTAAA